MKTWLAQTNRSRDNKKLSWTLKYCGREAGCKTTQTQTIYYGKERMTQDMEPTSQTAELSIKKEYSPDNRHAL